MSSESNQYLRAIQSVGSILEYYDSDKMIPMLGFGAAIPGIYSACHCFAMNGNIFNPEVFGIKGAIEVYAKALQKIRLSGPTYFAPILRYISSLANFYLVNGQYKYKQTKLLCVFTINRWCNPRSSRVY